MHKHELAYLVASTDDKASSVKVNIKFEANHLYDGFVYIHFSGVGMGMNQVIERMLDHRSIRSFLDKPLTEEQIHTIVECAQSAATSSYVQAYSIIGVSDPEKKAKLAELAGSQTYVEKSGHVFVFCADLHRVEYWGRNGRTGCI